MLLNDLSGKQHYHNYISFKDLCSSVNASNLKIADKFNDFSSLRPDLKKIFHDLSCRVSQCQISQCFLRTISQSEVKSINEEMDSKHSSDDKIYNNWFN